jgi:hypothetical protein
MPSHARRQLLIALAAFIVTVATARAAGPVAYTYTFIDFPNSNPGCIWDPGLNDLGQMIISDCAASDSNVSLSYLWQPGAPGQPGQLVPLHHPNEGYYGTAAIGISNAGEVVGSYLDANNAGHGFTYTIATGVWTTIDHPARDGVAPIVTDLRAIALRAGEAVGLPGAVVYPSGEVATIYNAQRSVIDPNPADLWQDLDGATDPISGALNSILGYPPTPAGNFANGINDNGVLVGRRLAPLWDAFVYLGGSKIATCPLYSDTVTTLPPGCTPRYFTYSVPNAAVTGARAISAAGDVVGWTFSDLNATHGDAYVRRHDGTFQTLTVVDPATNTSYAGYANAYSMNSLGQIAGVVYSPAQWNGTAPGARLYVATPAAASTPVPATNCAASSGGCDLSNGVIPHSVSGLDSLPGTVSESTCAVVPDPRLAQYGTCTGHTLKVSDVCPGYGDTVIPDYLCGGAGPANNGFVLARTVAEGVDALSGILVTSEAVADKALGGTSAACPATVGAWAPRSDSAVEGTIPEGQTLLDMTGSCGSSKIGSRGLSIYGIGLTLNTDALPGTTRADKLARFAASKYQGLFATIAEGNMLLWERLRVDACVAVSGAFFATHHYACAARQLVKCDAQVAANVGAFSGSTTNPNAYGDIRGRLANLYLTIDSRILGQPPASAWPVPLSSAPACNIP